MARGDFDFGAQVTKAEGKVFKNPEVGDHEAVISGIIHVGSFQDIFKKGNTTEVKKPANFVLVKIVLMGDDDKNEDDSRMEQWMPVPLKSGDKATLTKFLNAVDPKELLGGFDDFIGECLTATMVGSGDKNDDGSFKYVNWKGFGGMPDKLKKLVIAQVEEEGLSMTGHITFDKLTKEILDEIPANLVRQYFLNETPRGKNLSVAGSHVEAIIKAAREEDPEWKKAKKKDEEDATPANRKSLDTGESVPQEVPEADNAPAPEMDEDAEY